MNRNELIEYSRSQYDINRPFDKENLCNLYQLIHLREWQPDLYKDCLKEFKRMTHLFKAAFGFGLPLDESFLIDAGIQEETMIEYEQHGRGAAQQYARSWTFPTDEFERWEQVYAKRRERVVEKFFSDPEQEPGGMFEQAVLEHEGVDIAQVAKCRNEVLTELQRLTAEKGLAYVVHLKDNEPGLYRKTKYAFGRVPRAFAALGITQHYIVEHIAQQGELDRMLLSYLNQDRPQVQKIGEAYRLHHDTMESLLFVFRQKQLDVLREESNITASRDERKLDRFLHETRIDGSYVLHQHHEPYKNMVPGYSGRMSADVKIGRWLVEVTGGLEELFPSYREKMVQKKAMAKQAKIPLIVLAKPDFKGNNLQKALYPVLADVKRQGIKSIIPPGLLDFTDTTPITWAQHAPAYTQQVRNARRWGRMG